MKAVFIITIAWILSLLTTAAVFYYIPNEINPADTESSTKIVKMVDTGEKNITNSTQILNFTWIPENPDDNIILHAYVYFEYRCDDPPLYVWNWTGAFSWSIESRLEINNWTNMHFVSKVEVYTGSLPGWQRDHPATWQLHCYVLPYSDVATASWIEPNQGEYALKVYLSHEDRAWGSTPTFVRNITLLLEVADGII